MSNKQPRSRIRSRLWTLALSTVLGALAAALPHTPSAAQVLAPKGAVLAPEPAAPLSLTASDGSGLELVSLSARAVVEDPLAFTELHLVFRNPENRTREGRFRITLPSGATVSRFAMRVGDRWQEGEVVEQQAARIAYEDFLHRRQDPALLETEAGNEFSARVFPIPPAATKELIVSYSQELTRASEPYRLPLRGLPKLGSLSIRALVGKTTAGAGGPPASSLGGERIQREVIEVTKRDFRPDRDFEVAHAGARTRLGLRDQNLVVARVVPVADSDRRDDVASLLVLIDTSASRALGLADQLAAWEGLVAELRKTGGNIGGSIGGNTGGGIGGAGGDPLLTIAAFDQEVAPIFTGRASALGDVVRRRVLERRALGASDLDRALRWAADAARSPVNRRARVLLVTDGVATAGETGAGPLRQRVKALAAAGVERLDVLAVGGIREDALLTQLVTAGLARDGVVLDGGQPSAALVHRLTRATRSGIKLEIDGAGWIWPSVVNGVQPGDEILVYADLPAGKPLRVKAAGQLLALTGTLAPVDRPLLERAWVKARIARLLDLHDRNDGDGRAAADPDMKDLFKKQAIELSIKNRVLCPYTSLLVLETEQDYARFGIERRALADVITVGAAGIELVHRSEETAALATAPFADQPLEEAEKAESGALSARTAPASAMADEPELAKKRARSERVAMKDDDRLDRLMARQQPAREVSAGRGGAPAAVAAPPPAPARPTTSDALAATGRSLAEANARGGGESRPRPQPHRAHEANNEAPNEGMDDLLQSESPRADRRAMGAARAIAAPAMSAPAMNAPSGIATGPLADKAPQLPLEGALGEIINLIHRHDVRAANTRARAWREQDPGDVLALVALGECGEAAGDLTLAARAYGSIIDLFPGRADMRRFAGERLERVRGAAALALAVDTYRKAVEQRPDHPASHRLLAFALLKQGHAREAYQVAAAGAARRYPDGRFAGVERILREDLGLIAAAWMRAEPARADEIRAQLARAHGIAETAPSVRFVLNWETDANDVDFHIHDGRGGHAYYGARQLPSGGELYADVTTGYGPECFTIRGPAQGRAFPYRLQAHYYSRGPMGYGMGKLQVIEHDGHGAIRFDERPFVIMQDGAFVDLGTVTSSMLPAATATAIAVTKPN